MAVKFALLDQSVKKTGGHHLEYALRTLDSAKEAGFDPVLGAHVDFKPDATLAYKSASVFQYTFWENLQSEGFLKRLRDAYQKRKSDRAEKKQFGKRLEAFEENYSRQGLHLQRVMESPDMNNDLVHIIASDTAPIPSPMRALRWELLKIKMRARYGVFSAGLQNQKNRVPSRLRSILGLPWRMLRVLWRIFIIVSKMAFWGVLAAFSAPITAVLAPFIKVDSHRAAFRKDLKKFIKRTRLKSGDIAFIPSLGETEMLAMADLCKTSKLARSIKWRLLFRRDLYSSRVALHKAQMANNSVVKFKLALAHCRDVMRGCDIKFYTDTDPLTDQYNSLRIVNFETLCVPVATDFFVTPEFKKEDTIVAGYIGDAREEKGFGLLADAIDHIYKDYIQPGKLKLVAQANYNIPGGDGPSSASKLMLMAQPSKTNELIEGPLGSREYFELFDRGDIILVPYNPENYASRSSGIYAEGLVGGKPMIITRGSWMARLQEPYRQAYLRYLAQICENQHARLPAKSQSRVTKERNKNENTRADIGPLILHNGNTHVLTEVHFSGEEKNTFWKVNFYYWDIHGECCFASSETALVCNDTLYFINEMPEDAVDVSLEMGPLDGYSTITSTKTVVTAFHLPEGLPVSFASRIIEQDAKEIGAALGEIVDNFKNYSNMSLSLAKTWQDYCSADQIVAPIASEADVPPSPEAFADKHVQDYLNTETFRSYLKHKPKITFFDKKAAILKIEKEERLKREKKLKKEKRKATAETKTKSMFVTVSSDNDDQRYTSSLGKTVKAKSTGKRVTNTKTAKPAVKKVTKAKATKVKATKATPTRVTKTVKAGASKATNTAAKTRAVKAKATSAPKTSKKSTAAKASTTKGRTAKATPSRIAKTVNASASKTTKTKAVKAKSVSAPKTIKKSTAVKARAAKAAPSRGAKPVKSRVSKTTNTKVSKPRAAAKGKTSKKT